MQTKAIDQWELDEAKTLALAIKKWFPNKQKIADIGGCEGYLNIELQKLGYANVITFDECSEVLSNVKHTNCYFTSEASSDFDLLVGLNPCWGTTSLIKEAIRRRIPFYIKICCEIFIDDDWFASIKDRHQLMNSTQIISECLDNLKIKYPDFSFQLIENKELVGVPK